MLRTLLKIVIISSALLISVVTLLALSKGNFNPFLKKVTSSSVDRQQVFNKKESISENTLDINYNKYDGKLKSESDGKTIFGLGSSIESFNFNAVWDYRYTPFWANVKNVEKDTFKITLHFVNPISMPYVGTDATVSVQDCSEDASFLQDDSQNLNATQVDFFEEIKSGDDLISYCLSKECNVVGKLCKIYRE
jgi:hypothetical protein